MAVEVLAERLERLTGRADQVVHVAEEVPGAVVGWIHGVLFMIFCAALLRAMIRHRWTLLRASAIFLVALIPFGPFLFDRRITGWEGSSRSS